VCEISFLSKILDSKTHSLPDNQFLLFNTSTEDARRVSIRISTSDARLRIDFLASLLTCYRYNINIREYRILILVIVTIMKDY